MVSIVLILSGFLIGLAVCYYRQIKTVYDNKEKIGAVQGLASALGSTYEAFKF